MLFSAPKPKISEDEKEQSRQEDAKQFLMRFDEQLASGEFAGKETKVFQIDIDCIPTKLGIFLPSKITPEMLRSDVYKDLISQMSDKIAQADQKDLFVSVKIDHYMGVDGYAGYNECWIYVDDINRKKWYENLSLPKIFGRSS